jgi:hypothetical protein
MNMNSLWHTVSNSFRVATGIGQERRQRVPSCDAQLAQALGSGSDCLYGRRIFGHSLTLGNL